VHNSRTTGQFSAVTGTLVGGMDPPVGVPPTASYRAGVSRGVAFAVWGAIGFIATGGGCSDMAGVDSSARDASAAASDGAKTDSLTASFWDGSGDAGARSSADAAMGPDTAAAPMRGPTLPTGGTNFPFPQNRQSKNCIYPSGYRNEDVTAAYAQWKSDTVTTSGAGGFRRVQRLPSDPVPPRSAPRSRRELGTAC